MMYARRVKYPNAASNQLQARLVQAKLPMNSASSIDRIIQEIVVVLWRQQEGRASHAARSE